MLPRQGPLVQSLVRELSFHVPTCPVVQAKGKKKNKHEGGQGFAGVARQQNSLDVGGTQAPALPWTCCDTVGRWFLLSELISWAWEPPSHVRAREREEL